LNSIDLQNNSMKPADLQQAIQRDADSCVMCGMCLPHCPTYQVYQNEPESPRGRISIIQAYAQGRIQPDDNMRLHLDHCLGCMACEAMCPSNVAYGRLIDNAQAMLANTRPVQPKQLTLLLNQTRQEGGLNRYAKPLQWYKSSGLQKMAGGLLQLTGSTQSARTNDMLGLAQAVRLNAFYPAVNTVIGEVALFTGCMGTSFDGETMLNAIKLLTHLGYSTYIPSDQHCCGALHQHHGQPDQAQQLRQQNHSIFGKLPISHILYTANGCGAQLAQNNMPVPVLDIARFLLSAPTLATLRFKPLNETILIHESCSSSNKLKIAGAMRQLLQRIPKLQVLEPLTSTCCGAGSSHQILFPELADELLQAKLHNLKEVQAKYLLSDNLGCALHYKNSLNKTGLQIEAVHPITLLARQLD
jgi:glycolate oxidase iron-sulfur subunit